VIVPVLPSPVVETMTCKLCVAVLENKMWSFLVSVQGGGHLVGLFLDGGHPFVPLLAWNVVWSWLL
jgi:hypothetical protein